MRIRTILVDDEPWGMEQFRLECKDAGIDLLGSFTNAGAAISYAMRNTVELALLDVKLPDMDGILLGKKLREINRDMLLIYVSAYEEYIKEAILDVKADYYVLKPYNTRDVSDVLDRIRHLSARLRKRVRVRTFGEFDIFVDGQLLEFTNQKAKELLAFCIDSGGEVTMKRAVEVLWEDRDYDEKVKCLYRKAVISLHTVFRKYGVDDIFSNGRGSCHVNRQGISCDYYEVLDGKNIKETLFDGRYMTNYSWGEETCGRLCRMASEHLSD